MTPIPTDFMKLASPYPVECETCSREGEIVMLLKTWDLFSGIHEEKDADEGGWNPTETGWDCPSCADD